MRNSLIYFFFIFSTLTCFAGDALFSNTESKLIGDWQSGLQRYTEGLPSKDAFMRGQLGAILKFNADHTANIYLPCGLEDFAKSKGIPTKLSGQWYLDNDGMLNIHIENPSQGQQIFEKKLTLKFENSYGYDLLYLYEEGQSDHLQYGRLKPELQNCS